MALKGRACAGIAHSERFVPLVDPVSGTNKWLRRLSGKNISLAIGDAFATEGQDEIACYVYDNFDYAAGDKAGGFNTGIGPWVYGRLGKAGNKWVAAMFSTAGAVLNEGTTQFSPRAVYLINVRFDGTNIIYYVDGVAQITRADTGRPANNALDFRRVEDIGTATNLEPAGLEMYYNTCVYASGAAGDFAGRFPEVTDAHPNAQGFHNDFLGSPDATNKYLNWDDLAAFGVHDSATSLNWRTNVGIGRQSSVFTDPTFSNAVCIAVETAIVRSSVSGKDPISVSLICRQNSVDAERVVAGVSSTSFAMRNAGWSVAPDGTVWTSTKIYAAEWGVVRAAVGPASNLDATAIAVEVGAIGATEVRPGAPALAATGDRRRLLAA